MTTHRRHGVGPRIVRALVAALCGILGATALSTTPAAAADQRHAIYAIAHRVNTLDGVDAAINHGANAIEIDVCAWWNPNEWRAWHDCSSAGDNRRGTSFDSMLDRIISNANAGRRLSLVWLDIKDPNYCGEAENRTCSVAGLRDKAQRLTAAGIQVLYGFFEYHGGNTPDVGGRGWKSLEGKLGKLEGITTTGSRDKVRNAFNQSGAGFPNGRRVMDYGDTNITNGFGNCTEATWNTCAELKKGAADRAAGQLAATLSWTTTYNDPWYVDKLLGDAQVDGIIAGYAAFTGEREYDNSWQCANAINLIRDWVNRHSGSHRMANSGDRLFR
ncbi:phospholipase D [Streptomyces chrestomyceticus JCM 4735]|uniref:Phospholipase D n=1 Tax=Streptomyces chrestomyceticus JCM 4735 TaxID=1306181 RepID=A0A7U9KPT6_9ACTN|nr:phospholipase [Streptomyces chrestomyceticus]GCD32536.1 phospholipase D [Streptomyces chrestomyceticus JCM 4735]